MDLEAALEGLASPELDTRKTACIAITRHADAGEPMDRAVPRLARILERDALTVWAEATLALWAIARRGHPIPGTTVLLTTFVKDKVGEELGFDEELRDSATSALVHEYIRRGSSHAWITDQMASTLGGSRAIREIAERTGRMRGNHLPTLVDLVARGTDAVIADHAARALAAYSQASPRNQRAIESALKKIDAEAQARVRERLGEVR